jgi:diphthine synthase
VKEPDYEAMKMGKTKYLPPRFMSINVAISQLLEVENDRNEGIVTESSLAVGMARLGQPTQRVSIIKYYLFVFIINLIILNIL